MYKRILSLALLLALPFFALQLTTGATNAARPTEPVLTRDVFVHYPHGFSAKPSQPGGGGPSLCPDPATCPDYKLTRLSWPQPQASLGIPYVIDTTDSGLTETQVVSEIGASFATWTQASQADSDSTSIVFTYQGATSIADPNVSDGLNSLTFRDLSSSYPNAIAVTFAWHYIGSNAIIEAETVFNVANGFAWSTSGASSAYDLRNIATHEFGHWLQLGDLYKSKDSELTMYGYGTQGETKKTSLGYGDILGVQKLY